VAVEPASVLLSVLKHAEDPGGALVLRAYEIAGRPVQRATIDLPLLGRRIRTSFGAHQIKTFRVPADPALAAVEADLLERPRG
jgi:alpha-mannosidase